MATQVDAQELERRARALLDDRIGAARRLADARQQLLDRRAELDVAEREDGAAYAAALRAGWTDDELRKLGIDAPSRKLPGRPRRARPRSAAEPSPDIENARASDGTG